EQLILVRNCIAEQCDSAWLVAASRDTSADQVIGSFVDSPGPNCDRWRKKVIARRSLFDRSKFLFISLGLGLVSKNGLSGAVAIEPEGKHHGRFGVGARRSKKFLPSTAARIDCIADCQEWINHRHLAGHR